MITLDCKVLIYDKPMDMRKQIDGLSAVVANELEINPTTNETIFVFWNKTKDKVKALYWNANGFCLLYKRLEEGRFKVPNMNDGVIMVTSKELRWLLDGLDFNNLISHPKLIYEHFG